MNTKKIAKIIDIGTMVVGFLLGFRIILKFLGASTAAPFVKWLYEFTSGMLAPFNGIFPSPMLGRTSVVDISAFFAMIVYLLLGYFIGELVESSGGTLKIRDWRKKNYKDITKDDTLSQNPRV
ncbi:YggT family protein [Candidatus Nomurabacteria bacterium]|uniref:YggT family protein n=1 Tax=candidate division WWE3 bacterium TaxID=2053526 RepID=A0A955E1E9_UNCKA|nr:YggT family protein [candidate division WWE3 bacterium]MCB9823448.1 YggT family protein [Candidatus Nomurabacteria bacterium]MCB9827730.1 YggT family protein [Candidatus Nomurabacteria bacterium]HXK52772.1 YggT family protein [bacterium]